MPSAECGWCEVSLYQTKLIETCDEARCPFKRRVDPSRLTGPDAKPLSELSYQEMRTYYSEDDEEA